MPQIFPKWSNTAAKLLPIILVGGLTFVVFVFWYWCSPLSLAVGYQPSQPIEFSHKLHASDLKIDCMYCHHNAEKSAFAGVPSTQTCMNCHEHQSNKNLYSLAPLMRSYDSGGGEEGTPIAWKRVHKVADYAYFDHSAHVSAGVGCISCHGRVDQMQVVRQTKALSMGWCLDCHRDPAPHLRPRHEVTNMDYYQTDADKKMAQERAHSLNAPVESCSGCHR
jgi:hypothetical protein